MIGIVSSSADSVAAGLVLAAFRRSLTSGQVERLCVSGLSRTDFIVAINPDEILGKKLLDWLDGGSRKLVVLGGLPEVLRREFSATVKDWPSDPEQWTRSPSAETGMSAESPADIQYLPAAAALGAAGWQRPLERFDFTDEWNNLGFGAVRMDGTIWGLSAPIRVAAQYELAVVRLRDQPLASYCAVLEKEHASVLWFNRMVGPLDSNEWRLIEQFVSMWRHADRLPCLPVLSEIPYGYDSAVTMRLDCDEDITSARTLWRAYCEMGVPFALAIHTTNLADDRHKAFLEEFVAAGGALLSHTATHAPNWGGNYEAACREVNESRERIQNVTGVTVRYAVSPFHQTPQYAMEALCDAGFKGCIGGIIRNDPEFLTARGGELATLPSGFIGHSQQCMLHGDCMLKDGDSLAVFKAAYSKAASTRTLFGYLDHPFSPRYQYGWPEESSRVQAHRDLVTYIREMTHSPLFMDANQALDFLGAKARVRICRMADQLMVAVPDQISGLPFCVEYRGELLPVSDGCVLP